jgi:prevent-host-death family protein
MISGIPNSYTVTDLSRGRTDEILGKVQYNRAVITLTRYGKPIARIVPIEDSVVTDPTANISPTPAKAAK